MAFLDRVTVATGVVMLLAACSSTPYQPMGSGGLMGAGGGHSDEPLGDGTYLVTVKVNAYTDASTAYQYFHRRSAEMCRERGFRSYQVLDSDRSTKRSIVDVGNNRGILVEKARVFGRVECIGSVERSSASEVSFDAEISAVDTIAKRIFLNVPGGNRNAPVQFDSYTQVVYKDRLYPITTLEFRDLVKVTLRQIGPELFYAARIDVTVPVQERKD